MIAGSVAPPPFEASAALRHLRVTAISHRHRQIDQVLDQI
jgi:hypothetical protein